jgi:hypothetical protein
MRVKCFLVLGQHTTTGRVSVRRAVKTYPALDFNEAVVELHLEISDDIFDAPLVTVEATKREIAVAAEVAAAE